MTITILFIIIIIILMVILITWLSYPHIDYYHNSWSVSWRSVSSHITTINIISLHFIKSDRFDRAVTSDIKEIRHIPDDPYKVYNDMSYQNYHSIKMKNMVSKTKYTSEHYRSSTGVDQEIWRKELQLPPIQSALPWPSEKGGQAIQPIVWATWLPSWHCLWNLSTGPREASGKEFLN